MHFRLLLVRIIYFLSWAVLSTTEESIVSIVIGILLGPGHLVLHNSELPIRTTAVQVVNAISRSGTLLVRDFVVYDSLYRLRACRFLDWGRLDRDFLSLWLLAHCSFIAIFRSICRHLWSGFRAKYACKALVELGVQQLLELRWLTAVALMHVRGFFRHRLVKLDIALFSGAYDLFKRRVDVIFCNLLDDTGAEVGLLERVWVLLVIVGLLALALLVLVDLLVDANLLTHDTCKVDLLRFVVILEQSILNCFLKTILINWQIMLRGR